MASGGMDVPGCVSWCLLLSDLVLEHSSVQERLLVWPDTHMYRRGRSFAVLVFVIPMARMQSVICGQKSEYAVAAISLDRYGGPERPYSKTPSSIFGGFVPRR